MMELSNQDVKALSKYWVFLHTRQSVDQRKMRTSLKFDNNMTSCGDHK